MLKSVIFQNIQVLFQSRKSLCSYTRAKKPSKAEISLALSYGLYLEMPKCEYLGKGILLKYTNKRKLILGLYQQLSGVEAQEGSVIINFKKKILEERCERNSIKSLYKSNAFQFVVVGNLRRTEEKNQTICGRGGGFWNRPFRLCSGSQLLT